jgi:hypothetical protein
MHVKTLVPAGVDKQGRVGQQRMRASGQQSVVNQKHCVCDRLEMPARTPRSLQIWRSVPGGSGTPSGNVARPLHGPQPVRTRMLHTCSLIAALLAVASSSQR